MLVKYLAMSTLVYASTSWLYTKGQPEDSLEKSLEDLKNSLREGIESIKPLIELDQKKLEILKKRLANTEKRDLPSELKHAEE